MNTVYMDVPTNFVFQKKSSESHFSLTENFKMTVPLQIPSFEKVNLQKEAQRKIQEHKALRRKLKVLGNMSLSNFKPQKNPVYDDSLNKLFTGLPSLWNSNGTLKSLERNKISLPVEQCNTEGTPKTSKVSLGDLPKDKALENNFLKASTYSLSNSLGKSQYLYSPKCYQIDSSESNFKTIAKNLNIEENKRFQELTITSPKLKFGPKAFQGRAFIFSKNLETKKGGLSPRLGGSLDNQQYPLQGLKGHKPTMLNLMRNNSSLLPTNLLNTSIPKDNRLRNSPSPIGTDKNLTYNFNQDPKSSDRKEEKTEFLDEILDRKPKKTIKFEEANNTSPTTLKFLDGPVQKQQQSHPALGNKTSEKVKYKRSMRSLKEIVSETKARSEHLNNTRPQLFDDKVEELGFKIEKKLIPVDPIFNVEALEEDDLFLKELVAKSKENLPAITRQKIEFMIIRRRLLKRLNMIKNLKLTLREVYENPDMFGDKPYFKSGSSELMLAIKLGKKKQVKQLIAEKGKYIIHDFDNIHLTPLNMAAKRGYTDIAQLLIEYGADVNTKDIIGRTPLYFAIKNKDLNLIKILLENFATPWSTEDTNYKELIKENEVAGFYLSKMKKAHIGMQLTAPDQRKTFWEREALSILNSQKNVQNLAKDEQRKNNLRWFKLN